MMTNPNNADFAARFLQFMTALRRDHPPERVLSLVEEFLATASGHGPAYDRTSEAELPPLTNREIQDAMNNRGPNIGAIIEELSAGQGVV
jgi:hypothetical protein